MYLKQQIQLGQKRQHLRAGFEDNVIRGRTAVDAVAVKEVAAVDATIVEQLDVAECERVEVDMGVAVDGGVGLCTAEELPQAREAIGTSRIAH